MKKVIKKTKQLTTVKDSNVLRHNSSDNSASRDITLRNDWDATQHYAAKLRKPILIEGMPGIGNVGKIVMDILIEETKAKLLMSFFSKNMPNSVFVNEDNLIDLPNVSMYHKRINDQDFLFLTADAQPTNEISAYNFSELIVHIFKNLNGQHIVTLGGIGLGEMPGAPKVYITGNNKMFVTTMHKILRSKKLTIEPNIYGHVGPIIGVSGLLLGVSKKNDVKAYSLLAETFGHPLFVGLKGARAILHSLNSMYGFNLKFEKLDKEILQVDSQMNGTDANDTGKDKMLKYKRYSEVNYIG